MKVDIKTSQKISIEILKIVSDVCEQLNLNYFLMYGTLIGAVRHHGFIPWDDDVDIMMPRKDHDILVKYFLNNPEALQGLELFNPMTCKNYPYMITRISNPNYKIKMKNEEKYGMGIFIDIYPFDGLGDNWNDALKMDYKGDLLSSLCYLSTRKHFAKENTKGLIKNIIKFPAFLIAKIIGKNYFQKKLMRLPNDDFYESTYVACVTWTSGGERGILKEKWFEEFCYLPFENFKFRVPKDYDKVLRHIYGDYMKLPPFSERRGHHFYELENN